MRKKSPVRQVVNEDPTEVLKADKFMVEVRADNASNVDLNGRGSSYGIYVLKPECRRLITLLQKMVVIRPLKNDDNEEEVDEKSTSNILYKQKLLNQTG